MSPIHKLQTNDRWYYAAGKRKLGPFSFGQLREFAVTGQLQSGSMVWQEGAEKWVTAQEVGCQTVIMAVGRARRFRTTDQIPPPVLPSSGNPDRSSNNWLLFL
jgi:uncharacterized protein DUF4339